MATPEEMDYYAAMEQELNDAMRDKRTLANAQLSMFGMPNDENLIKWQLDFKEDLDRIYHLLKGHKLVEDEEGNLGYVPQEDEDLVPFNEFGVQLIMNIMSFYLNRNTILSNYDLDTISWKVQDFGITLVDLIYNRYHEMMITTSPEKEFKKLFNIDVKLTYDHEGNEIYVTEVKGEDGDKVLMQVSDFMVDKVNERMEQHILGKITMYDMICLELIDSVHSAYLRALNAGERRSLREARTVTQTDNPLMKPQSSIPMVSQPKQMKIWNPMTWLGGGR